MDESNKPADTMKARRGWPVVRGWLLSLPWVLTILCAALPAQAAPMARILRIDPRVAATEHTPILTVVVDLVQSKRISQAVSDCAMLTGDAQLDCEQERLIKPNALFTPFPFPERNAHFLVGIDGVSKPAEFVWKGRWRDEQNVVGTGVGTAWLILLDAAANMGSRLADAQATAESFLNSMKPNDIVKVMAFDGRQVVKDSHWLPASQVGTAISFVRGIAPYPPWSRVRPLAGIIRSAVNDAFHDLAVAPSSLGIPLHQALVVLSDGSAGLDPMSTGPGAVMLQRYLAGGRFPDEDTARPMTPLPTIAVWFPRPQIAELLWQSKEFMTQLAATEIGGQFFPVRSGADLAPRIVEATRTRFEHMHVVKYRLPCMAPSMKQTFLLVFSNIKPMVGGDASFKDVSGIDPTTWPLDIDVERTAELARKNPVRPGETFRVVGNFCWGEDRTRPDAYFLSNDRPAPAGSGRELMAAALRGKPMGASDTFADFEAPADPAILFGSGNQTVVRLLVADSQSKRTSPVRADKMLVLEAEPIDAPAQPTGVRVATAQPGPRGGRCGCRVGASSHTNHPPELVLILAFGILLHVRRSRPAGVTR